MLSAANMKVYKRIHTPEENRPFRLGCLLQNIQSCLPEDGKFANLIGSFQHSFINFSGTSNQLKMSQIIQLII